MDNELRLGETAINYLKARLTKLGQQDRLVSLIIDEVYTQREWNMSVVGFMEWIWKTSTQQKLYYVLW